MPRNPLSRLSIKGAGDEAGQASGAQTTEDADLEEWRHTSSAATPEDLVAPLMLLPLGTRIFSAFRNFANLVNAESAAFRGHMVTESERFALWAQNLGLSRQGHASLDYRVRDAKVPASVSRLNASTPKKIAVQHPQAKLLTERPRSNTAEATSAGSECSSSSSSFHEIDFRQRSITEAIDALYSLATKMRNPRNRPQRAIQDLYKHIPPQLRERYIREREEAEIMIVSHIQRQSLSGALRRLRRGDESSALSEQQFIYWREHAARIRGSPTDHSVGRTSNPKGKGTLLEEAPALPRLHMEPRAAPSLPRQSLATSATRLDEEAFVHHGDLHSVISHHNRASTVVTSQGPKLEWPSPPPHLTAGSAKFIICPYCHVICPRKYLAKDTWRSHIIHDLEPYQCTYEDCPEPNRLYGSYQEWIDHESQHTRVWHCHRHAREFETQSEYMQHLQQDHPDAGPEQSSPELVSAAVGPSLRVHRDCPLCPTALTEV
ncbi:hypothetical protein MFIFM68171_02662 [Madurella fahalii]|uniref:C2H2-type domain-containing protein n=1 Tax=Madurella fahalii TaxID=1157608 RepID=A0ABQ0G3X8_9PEZI